LRELAGLQLDLLAVNGGDGTVQALLTALLRDRPFVEQPALALLSGGTTNMTAGDVGVWGSPLGALRRLVDLGRPGAPAPPLVQRPVLKLLTPSDGEERYGMFFGTGAIVNGIEYCHAKVHSRGLGGSLAPTLCTLRVLFAMGRGDRRYAPARAMTVSLGPLGSPSGTQTSSGDYLLVLASPLERLFLGLRPYWGPPRGAFHFTSLRARPRRPWRNLPGLFWGRPGPGATPENGYFSAMVDEVRLAMEGPVTLDGEIYHASLEDGPVQLSVGGWVSFVGPR
jgi:hypothetical protein